MAPAKKMHRAVQRSISLHPEVDQKVQRFAKRHKQEASEVLADLIIAGLQAAEGEDKSFFKLLKRLQSATDPQERQELKGTLINMIYNQ